MTIFFTLIFVYFIIYFPLLAAYSFMKLHYSIYLGEGLSLLLTICHLCIILSIIAFPFDIKYRLLIINCILFIIVVDNIIYAIEFADDKFISVYTSAGFIFWIMTNLALTLLMLPYTKPIPVN